MENVSNRVTGNIAELGTKANSEVSNNDRCGATESAQKEEGRRPFDHTRLVDRYVEGKAHILLHLRDGKGAEFIACLRRYSDRIRCGNGVVGGGVSVGADRFFSSVESCFLAWSHCAADRFSADGQQQAMFVYNVQLMELPEPMTPPTLVWLDSVENFVAILPKAWYFSSRKAWVVFGAITDWESNVLVGSSASSNDESISQMVERAAQVVNGVAQHKREFVGDVGDLLNVKRYLSTLDIILTTDVVGISNPESINGGLKLLDVLLGPIVFC